MFAVAAERSEVVSMSQAEDERMSGRLPALSLRVSTSSLACFCHKLLFGLDLIRPPTHSLRSALCRPSGNLQHQAPDASTNTLAFRCVPPNARQVDVSDRYRFSQSDALRFSLSNVLLIPES